MSVCDSFALLRVYYLYFLSSLLYVKHAFRFPESTMGDETPSSTCPRMPIEAPSEAIKSGTCEMTETVIEGTPKASQPIRIA